MRTRALVGAATAVTMLAVVPTPAGAATRGFNDSRADGYDHYNIVRVVGNNAAKRFVTTVRYENLPRGWAGWTNVFLKRKKYSQGPSLQVRRTRSGTYRVKMWNKHRVRCRGLHGRYSTRRDRLRLSIPQRCLPGRPHAWRLYVYGGDAGWSHAADWTRTGPRIRYR